MYWFWHFLFVSQPPFLLLGLLGVFGKEAEKVAEDLVGVLGIVILVLVVLAVVLFGGCALLQANSHQNSLDSNSQI